jgi:hypothetical protein
MKVTFRVDDSNEMEKAVSGLIELLKTKGGFYGVHADSGLMIKGTLGWRQVRPRKPWNSPENDALWAVMVDKLYMERWLFRWWVYGGKYGLYYDKPDRYWCLMYEGNQFNMHMNSGIIGNYIRNMMLQFGGEPYLHVEESPGLAWTDVDGTEKGRRLLEQKARDQEASRQRREQQRAERQAQHQARQAAEQAAAQQRRAERKAANAPQRNPVLDRLAAVLVEKGYNYKSAFVQAKSQLNQAEKEARHLEKLATDQQLCIERKVSTGMRQLAGQLAAQQNPLLARLTEDMIRYGHGPINALDQAKGRLNKAEKEARHIERMAAEQAAAQSRRTQAEAEKLARIANPWPPSPHAAALQRIREEDKAAKAEWERQRNLPDIVISLS